jgi:hypothetical protein
MTEKVERLRVDPNFGNPTDCGDRPGADAIMALVALQQPNIWKSYWESRKHTA